MATSTLNPNAPIFVPFAYRAVEDFSDQWYDLVHSSPWFRDYWLHECFQDPQDDVLPSDDFFDSALSDHDVDLHFDNQVTRNSHGTAAVEQNGSKLDLISLGLLKWRKQPRGPAENTKYGEKVPKIVSVRVNPRPIKQPR